MTRVPARICVAGINMDGHPPERRRNLTDWPGGVQPGRPSRPGKKRPGRRRGVPLAMKILGYLRARGRGITGLRAGGSSASPGKTARIASSWRPKLDPLKISRHTASVNVAERSVMTRLPDAGRLVWKGE